MKISKIKQKLEHHIENFVISDSEIKEGLKQSLDSETINALKEALKIVNNYELMKDISKIEAKIKETKQKKIFFVDVQNFDTASKLRTIELDLEKELTKKRDLLEKSE